MAVAAAEDDRFGYGQSYVTTSRPLMARPALPRFLRAGDSIDAGVIVTLIALTVSLPVAIATAIFYVVYRLAEDYLIVPRVIGRVIEVPATVTIVAVLVGGAILGIVGALVAIPVAAALRILLFESVFPRLDRR